MNIDALSDSKTDLLFADAMKTAGKWGSLKSPWDGTAPVDANGWPTSDAGVPVTVGTGIDVGGTYALSFTGQAASIYAVATNASVINKAYNASTNTTTAQVVVQPGTQIYLDFSGTRRLPTDTTATGITHVVMTRPTAPEATSSYASGTLFTTPILNLLSNFQAIRFYNFTATAGSMVANWSDRTLPWQNQSAASGGSWEYAVALANATNEDMWINIPELATPDYVTKLAELIDYGSDGVNPYTSPQAHPIYPPLNSNLHVYVEDSNEVWSSATKQGQQNNAAAAAEAAQPNSPITYDGDTYPVDWSMRRIAEQIMDDSLIFRSVFGDSQMMTRIRPVFEFQYGNLNNSAENGLDFLNNYYNNADGQQHVADPHPVSYFLWGAGGAWYGSVNNASGLGDVTIPNSGFATPAVSGSAADPTGAGWTFTGAAGIAANGSTLGNPAAPVGTQTAYLQGTGSFSQTVTFSGGSADLTFSAAQGSTGSESVSVYIDGALVGSSFTPTSNAFGADRTAVFSTGVSAGAHTVQFVGSGTGTLFIDNINAETINGMYNSGVGSLAYVQQETNWAAAYGLQDTAYEGGFDIGGDSATPLQKLANLDPRAQQAALADINAFFQDGGDLAMVFDSTGSDAYGLTPDPNNLSTPKMLAVASADAAPQPAVTTGTVLPATSGQSIRITEDTLPIDPGVANARIYTLLAAAAGTYTVTLSGVQDDLNAVEHLMLDGAVLPGLIQLPAASSSPANSSPSITFTISSPGFHALSLFVDGPGSVQLLGGDLTITAGATAPALPAVPTGVASVSATAVSASEIDLSWASAAGAAGYRIERSIDGIHYSLVENVAAPATTYADVTAAPGTSYVYRVRAYNSGGFGAYSPVSSASVTSAAVVPSPWLDEDYGTPTSAGFATKNASSGAWTVGAPPSMPGLFGITSDLLGASDQFNFLHTSASGNFSIVAQVTILSDSDGMAKAGLMVRDADTASAAFVAIVATPDDGINLIYRSADGAAGAIAATIPAGLGPVWLQLSRSGNVFIASMSANGSIWQPVGGAVAVSMPSSVVAGVAATSDNILNPAAALVASLTLTPGAIGSPQLNLTASGGTYNGKPFVATATVAAGASTPVVQYFAGTYSDPSQLTGANAPTPISAPTGVGAYTVLATAAANATFAGAAAIANFSITPTSLTASFSIASKIYNGTTAAAISGSSLSGVIGADVVSLNLTGATASFSDKNVDASKTVTIAAAALSGAGAGNYVLTVKSAVGAITPATLTASFTIASKVYNGSTAATIQSSGLAGVVGGDVVSLNLASAVATFADKNVGAGKVVTVTGAALAGAGAGNYVLSVKSPVGAITPATVTATVTVSNKVYDGTTAGVIATRTLKGVLGADVVSLSSTAGTATFADKNAGTAKSVAVTGLALAGAGAGNYVLASTSTATTASITKRTLTVTANSATRAYGLINPTFTGAVAGAAAGDVFSLSFATTATRTSNVGAYAITPTANGPSGWQNNYAVTTASGVLNVVAAPDAFSSLLAPTLAHGAASVTLGGTLSYSGLFPPGVVKITIGGTSLAALSPTISSTTGKFSASFAIAKLAKGTYTVTYAYAGSASFKAVTQTVKLILT